MSSLRCGPHQPLDPVLSRPLGAARRPVDNSGELPTALLTATRHLKNDRSYLKSSLLLPCRWCRDAKMVMCFHFPIGGPSYASHHPSISLCSCSFTSNVSSRPRAASVTISSGLSCWPRSASVKRSVRICTNALCGAGRRRRNSAVFPASAAGQPTRRRRGGSSCSTSGRTGDLFSLLVYLFVSLFVVL